MKQEKLLRVAKRLAQGAVVAYALAIVTILVGVFVANNIDAATAFVIVAGIILGFASNAAGVVLTITGEFAEDVTPWKWTWPFLANAIQPAMAFWILLKIQMMIS
jgi:hypothetical protein